MKVVLFCGGLGTRLREYSTTIPKPMVEIGYRPIIWHLMKYYAHFGHKDFILCLGYRGDYIKNYFLNYDECLSNNFVLTKGGQEVHLYNSDVSEWTISFIDTGLNSNIGQRLKAAEPYLGDDEIFLANYSDGLTDLPLNEQLDHFYRYDKVASMLCVKPPQSFDVLSMGADNFVADMEPINKADLWINGGFFIFKRDIFDYIQEGEELVREPFQRLIAQNEIIGYRYSGFWSCMDTFKEKTMFDEMYARGDIPWAVWEQQSSLPQQRMLSRLEKVSGDQVVMDRSHLVAHYRQQEPV